MSFFLNESVGKIFYVFVPVLDISESMYTKYLCPHFIDLYISYQIFRQLLETIGNKPQNRMRMEPEECMILQNYMIFIQYI